VAVSPQCRLTFSPDESSDGLEHTVMTQTESEQLHIDLIGIYSCSYGYIEVITDEVELLTLVDYQKEQIIEVEKNIGRHDCSWSVEVLKA
jgi:hypothetical protein